MGLKPEFVNQLSAADKLILSANLVQTQTKFAQSELGKSIMAVAVSQAQGQGDSAQADATASNQTKAEVIAVEAVKLLGYIEDYQRAEDGNLPDIPAALIGL